EDATAPTARQDPPNSGHGRARVLPPIRTFTVGPGVSPGPPSVVPHRLPTAGSRTVTAGSDFHRPRSTREHGLVRLQSVTREPGSLVIRLTPWWRGGVGRPPRRPDHRHRRPRSRPRTYRRRPPHSVRSCRPRCRRRPAATARAHAGPTAAGLVESSARIHRGTPGPRTP